MLGIKNISSLLRTSPAADNILDYYVNLMKAQGGLSFHGKWSTECHEVFVPIILMTA